MSSRGPDLFRSRGTAARTTGACACACACAGQPAIKPVGCGAKGRAPLRRRQVSRRAGAVSARRYCARRAYTGWRARVSASAARVGRLAGSVFSGIVQRKPRRRRQARFAGRQAAHCSALGLNHSPTSTRDRPARFDAARALSVEARTRSRCSAKSVGRGICASGWVALPVATAPAT